MLEQKVNRSIFFAIMILAAATAVFAEPVPPAEAVKAPADSTAQVVNAPAEVAVIPAETAAASPAPGAQDVEAASTAGAVAGSASTASAVEGVASTASLAAGPFARSGDPNDPNNWTVPAAVSGKGADGKTTPMSTTGGGIARVILSLGIVLGLIAAAVWAFRRFAPRTASVFASENLKVIARTHVGPKQAIYMVRVPGKLIVVGATQESITALSEITDPVDIERTLGAFEASSSGGASAAFGNILAGVTGRKKPESDSDAQLADAVKTASDRVASLNRKLRDYEQGIS